MLLDMQTCTEIFTFFAVMALRTIPRCDAGRNGKPQTVNLGIMLQPHLDSLAHRDIPDAGAEDIIGVLFQ